MNLYKVSQLNLLVVLNHLPAYGLEVVQVTSEIVEGELVYTIELSGPIPEDQMSHLNSVDGYYLEAL